MRVLHVAESIKGGVGSYLANLAPFQSASLGVDNVRFLVPTEHRSQLNGVDPRQIRSFVRPDRSAGSLGALASALGVEAAAFDPHLIHVHSTFAGLIARPMFGRRSSGPSLVYCPHGWAFNVKAATWKRALLEGVERSLAPFADAVVAISAYEEAEGRRIGISPTKLHLIRNGVPELAPAPPVDPSWSGAKLKVLFVGRLDRQKGVDLLLKAALALGERVSIRIVGDSVTGHQDLDLPGNTTSLGWLGPAAIGAQLASCDVVVVPSRWEGFGLVAVEAMRAGKPVIATRVGGLPEILGEADLGDGPCGQLIAPESPHAIQAALLAMDVGTRRAMGARGRQRYLDRFTAERMSNSLLELYDQVVSRRSARSTVPPRRFGIGEPAHAGYARKPAATSSPMARIDRQALTSADEAL